MQPLGGGGAGDGDGALTARTQLGQSLAGVGEEAEDVSDIADQVKQEHDVSFVGQKRVEVIATPVTGLTGGAGLAAGGRTRGGTGVLLRADAASDEVQRGGDEVHDGLEAIAESSQDIKDSAQHDIDSFRG